MGVLGIIPGGRCLDAPIAVSTRCTVTYSDLRTRIYESLLPHQQEFVDDTDHLLLGLCAGFGAGKTVALAAKCVFLAMDNPGKVAAVFEPTFQMVLDVWVRSFDEFLDRFGIEFDYRASPQPEYILHLPRGHCTILCRTLEAVNRIRGTNLAFALAAARGNASAYVVDTGQGMHSKRVIREIKIGFCDYSTMLFHAWLASQKKKIAVRTPYAP